MAQFFNQYSYALISLALILGAIFLARALRLRWRSIAIIAIALGIICFVGWLSLRPGESDITSAADAQAILVNGKPTLVEFFSKYCLGCIQIRPAVDQLVSQIEGDFNILRVDIHTELGGQLRDQFGFAFSPEFILFEASGTEIWRDHTLPSDQQLALATGEAISVE